MQVRIENLSGKPFTGQLVRQGAGRNESRPVTFRQGDREKTATLAKVQDATARAAHLQGRLRATHLKYHLTMVEVLSLGQVRQYNQLRGYR